MIKVIICLSILLLASCDPSNVSIKKNETIESTDTTIESTDTTIKLVVNSKSIEFKISKKLKLNFQDFQNFLNEYANKALELNDTISIDITGDGKNERLITKIINQANGCFIYANIYDSKKNIYSDTLKINEDLSFNVFWDNDSLYYNLKPYTTFYEALFNRWIIDKFDTTRLNDKYRSEFFLNNQKNNFEKLGLDSVTINYKMDSLNNFLNNFKGQLVYTMHQLDRVILIWDENKKQFISFYEP